MMNNITITDSAQFEEVINSLEISYNVIKEILKKEIDNKERINKTDAWSGPAQEAMYDKYVKLSNNFEPIDYSLKLYIVFLKKTLEDYKRIEEEINKNIDILQDNLDVNS